MAKAGRKHIAAVQRSIYPPPPELVGLDPDEHSLEPLARRRERRERYFRRFIDKADRTKMVDRTRFRLSEVADALSTLPDRIIPDAAKREAALTMLCQEILRGEFDDQKGRPQIAYLHPSPLAPIRLNTKGMRLEDIRKISDQLWVKRQPCLDYFARKKWPLPKDWVLAQVPADLPVQTTTANQAVTKTAATSWVRAEAQRLKAAGKIPKGIHITDLAKLLATQMSKAARTDPSIRPVGWKHIKNELPGWGLWPISLIKC
jgi:hypothetical protein